MPDKFISIIACILISGTAALSQSLEIRTESAIGTFMMNDLKNFQEISIPDLGVNVESLSKFPPYFGYGISIVHNLKSGIGFGITSDYFSTGGTNYYEDYSGSYKLKILTHAYNIGTVFTIKNLKRNHLNSFFEIQQGLKFSGLSMSEELIVNNPILSSSFNLVSTSWWIKPAFRVEYKFFDFLSAGAFLGVEINPKSNLHVKGNKDAILRNFEGEKVTINWSGLRAGLHLSFIIPDWQPKNLLPIEF
jgi:hypothetical protein